MKNLDSVQFIDDLAEITSFESRELIEKSLIETLQEYHNAKSYWLYQVLTKSPKLSLGLLAYSTKKSIITTHEAVAQKLPNHIYEGVIDAVSQCTSSIIRNPKDKSEVFLIYPALDAHKDVFAILIERAEAESLEDKRLAHSFLKIYANYLRLLEKTRRDKLTNLLNRETLEDEITRILILNSENVPPGFENEPDFENNQRSHNGNLRYWLGVLDIDHFKNINDTYGHLYGDDILILVAQLMTDCVRSYDLVFRYGGEEFVILLKAFSEDDAKASFERIRNTIGSHQYAKVEQVTVSIGVTEIYKQMAPSDVIDESDSALYYAKENGRNQTQFYRELVANRLISVQNPTNDDSDISFF